MDANWKGRAKRVTDLDIPRIAAIIGTGEDELHAFMDVEAAGSGFDSQGRVKMLFEGHKFFKNLSGAERDEAVKQGLAWPKWDPKGHPYPRESYTRLTKAAAINREAALKSCSWGLTQIMGEYHDELGYPTAEAMVEAFADDEANHLEATVKLLVLWKIDDDLRAHNWAKVAEVWNGPGYKQNKYDAKMRNAFAKWQNIRDTVWPPKDYTPPIEIKPVPTETVEIKVPVTVPDPQVIDKPVVTEVKVETQPAPKPPAPESHRNKLLAGLAALIAMLPALAKCFGVN